MEDFEQRYQLLLEQADQVQAEWAQAQQQADDQRLAQVQLVIQHVQQRLAQAAAQSGERLTYMQRAMHDAQGQESLRHILEWKRPYPPRQLIFAFDLTDGLARWGWGWWVAPPQSENGTEFQTHLKEEVPFGLVTTAAVDQLILLLLDQSVWHGERAPDGSLLPAPVQD